MKLFKLWGPVAVWAGVIFLFSSIPNLKTELEYDFLLRKIAHITEYFILTFLLYRAFVGSFNMNPVRLFMYPAALSLLYAMSDEIHQYFVVGRNCAIQDVLIDSVGIISLLIFVRIKKGCPCKKALLTTLIVLFSSVSLWAQSWEKQGDYYFLTKNNRDNFSLVGAGPNKFASKYLKYDGVDFLVGGASSWQDYGRLNLEYDNIFSLPIKSGIKVEEVHLLAGGNYSNSYEHDGIMRLYGDKYFYATLSAIFIYENGLSQELSVPVYWDWFKINHGAWSKRGATIKSLGENPVRPICYMYHITFVNPKPQAAIKNIIITDSWIDDRPFSDVFALTLKSTDALDAIPKEDK